MKKIGLLSLALVLALGALGVGYAAWTDTITIEGTVNTGSVGGSIEWVSGTWVYKVVGMEPDEMVVQHDRGSFKFRPPAPDGGELIAYAEVLFWAEPLGGGPETVTVKFDNLFPVIDQPLWYDFVVDILWHYDGSVPAKVNSIGDFVLNPDPGTNPELLDDLRCAMSMYRCTEDGMPLDKDGNVLPLEDLRFADFIEPGDQLHYCDYVMILIGVDVPQDNTLMDLSGSFTFDLDVVQWNEYPH